MDCNPPGLSVHGLPRQDTGVSHHFLLQGTLPNPGIESTSSTLAGGLLTTKLSGKLTQSLTRRNWKRLLLLLCNFLTFYLFNFDMWNFKRNVKFRYSSNIRSNVTIKCITVSQFIIPIPFEYLRGRWRENRPLEAWIMTKAKCGKVKKIQVKGQNKQKSMFSSKS